jgi:hypothetical protein
MSTSVDLDIGGTYFMLTFPDAELATPVVLSYRYLGKDLLAPAPSPQYYFRYLPPFESESGPSEGRWTRLFPHLFSGWGEPEPTVFDAEKVQALLDLRGLIRELEAVVHRSTPS